MRITEGHLGRHYQGRAGGRDPALLDIAQDHALAFLTQAGVFELGAVFKGGTAIRKYRAGNAGRFSTDLDFAVSDPDVADFLLESLDGAELDGFTFSLNDRDGVARAALMVDTPFGRPTVPAKLDLSRRSLWLTPEKLNAVHLPIHDVYDIEMSPIPVMRLEEIIAEKLARYRRTSLARDLYDLAWAAQQAFDESLVRRLWIMKSFTDIVEDGLGSGPIEPDDILRPREEKHFVPEQIGYLTRPVDVAGWIAIVRTRFAFLTDLTDEERKWAVVDRRDAWTVTQAAADLADP